MLATWLSYRDLAHLVERALAAPGVEHMVVYGMSDNAETYWDNTMASSLGFRPQDSAESFREKLETTTLNSNSNDPLPRHQGGTFTNAGHFEDEN